MKNITSEQLRNLYIEFFKSKGHKQIPSASVIPENDPTVLFTTAGMHPLVPYLLGEKHPQGNRLTDYQKCIRTGDIDEVGDSSHCTFFEMLGNWSLGDYFKKEMIPWSYEFLTSDKFLGIDKDKIAVSVFCGDETAPRDEESAKLWQDCGIDKSDIYFLPKEHNWWGPAGTTGPCGPDTEMFIKVKEKCCENCSPACDCGAFLEIWNDVFMAYNKLSDGSFADDVSLVRQRQGYRDARADSANSGRRRRGAGAALSPRRGALAACGHSENEGGNRTGRAYDGVH